MSLKWDIILFLPYNLYCKSIHVVIPQVFMISTNTKCNSFDVYICMLVCVCSKGPLFWEIKYLYCIVHSRLFTAFLVYMSDSLMMQYLYNELIPLPALIGRVNPLLRL